MCSRLHVYHRVLPLKFPLQSTNRYVLIPDGSVVVSCFGDPGGGDAYELGTYIYHSNCCNSAPKTEWNAAAMLLLSLPLDFAFVVHECTVFTLFVS